MHVNAAIREALAVAERVCLDYLDDLTNAELLHRPCPGANHIAWQLGHLIVSEHAQIESIRPGAMPPLPSGFDRRYARETASCDDPDAWDGKPELLRVFRQQRAGTLAALEATSDDEFDRPTGIGYAPNVAAMFLLQSTHWLMHAGQWAVIRRQLGRPPLY